MELIIQLVIDTILVIIIAMIFVGILLYWDKNRKSEITDIIDKKILKLKFKRNCFYVVETIIFFSMFIHLGIFIISGLISGEYPGLSLNNGFGGILGIIMSMIFLIILFWFSVPNIIILFQFYECELGRTIVFDKANRTIELYQNNAKTIIRNEDITCVVYHEQKLFAYRGPKEWNYLEIRYFKNSVLIITDLLMGANILSPLEPVFKGVKREYKEKVFNRII
ncbi:MAG: hypothetical protein WCH34_07710 [Bacteroidota bacterium]